jgi:hypothetical protein
LPPNSRRAAAAWGSGPRAWASSSAPPPRWAGPIDLEQGEIAVVLGPNGAGSSTLFDLHSGVSTPDGGRVLIGGTVAEHQHVHALGPQPLRHLGGLSGVEADARHPVASA